MASIVPSKKLRGVALAPSMHDPWLAATVGQAGGGAGGSCGGGWARALSWPAAKFLAQLFANGEALRWVGFLRGARAAARAVALLCVSLRPPQGGFLRAHLFVARCGMAHQVHCRNALPLAWAKRPPRLEEELASGARHGNLVAPPVSLACATRGRALLCKASESQ